MQIDRPTSLEWFTAALDKVQKNGLSRPLTVIDDIQKCLGSDGQFSSATKGAIEVLLEAQMQRKADVVFLCSDADAADVLTLSGILYAVVCGSLLAVLTYACQCAEQINAPICHIFRGPR